MTKILFRLVLCLAVISLGVSLWPVAEPSIGKWRDDFATSQRGFASRQLFHEDGSRTRYVVFVPHLPPDSESGHPVILFLNGQGENGDDGYRQISNNFGQQIWERKGTFPFLCVAPQCRMRGAWSAEGEDTATALNVLDQVLSDYHVDPDRVYLMGVSSGGIGALQVAAAYPDRFAAVVAVAATKRANQLATKLAHDEMPLWTLFNANDKESVAGANRALRQSLDELGVDSHVTEYDRTGHDAWNFALRESPMYAWLFRQSRDHRDHVGFEYAIDDELSNWRSMGSGQWVVTDEKEIEFLPNESGDAGDRNLLTLDKRLVDFDFRFDYRGVEAPNFEIQLSHQSDQGESSDQREISEYWLKVCPPNGGGSGLVDSDGNWIALADPVAQFGIRPKTWNNVRLRLKGGSLRVSVNGWQLIEIDKFVTAQQPTEVSLVGRRQPGEKPRWRGIAFRELTGMELQKLDTQPEASP